MSMTEKTEEMKELVLVLCIWYAVSFKDKIGALLDSKSEVNAISQAFAHQLGFKIRKTNVGAQKIDGTILETYRIVVSTFFVLDKNDKERFFEVSFLLANIKPDIVLKMPFLTMSNIDVDFQARELQWRSYTTGDVLLTIKRVELIGKKEFTAAVLNPEYEAFVVHVAVLNLDSGDEMHPWKRAQIAYLKADEAPSEVSSKYADFADVFSSKLATKLSEYMRVNDHAIGLIDDWQPQ